MGRGEDGPHEREFLEEKWESRGERAALPSHHPPSPLPWLAPPGLCFSIMLLPPQPGLGKRGNPSAIDGVFHSQIIYGRSICRMWGTLYLISAFMSSSLFHNEFGYYSSSWTR